MRILHVIRTLDPAWGGPIEGVRNITNEAIVQGHIPEILCSDESGASWLPAWKPKVHALGPAHLTYGFNRLLGDWLLENLAKFEVVVLHGIWMFHSYAVWKATRKVKVPYYLFIHGALDPWFEKRYPLKHIKKVVYWKIFEHKVLRDAEYVLFTTIDEMQLADRAFLPYVCSPIVSSYGISRPRLVADFDKSSTIERMTVAYPALRNRPFLLLLARIHEKKGVDLLFKAFAAVKHLFPNTALVIAGPGSPEIVSKLSSLADALGITDNIVWTGPIYGDAKCAAIRAADAYVLPSHQENFGISVVEALAYGTPVLISTKVNICREVLSAGAGLVAPDDVPGTTKLLQDWSALSSGEKAAMRASAAKCFNSNFDLSTTSKKLFEMLSIQRSGAPHHVHA